MKRKPFHHRHWENKNLKENFGIFDNQFSTTTKKLICGLETIKTKINKHDMSKPFNQTCSNENMLPKYTYIEPASPFVGKNNILSSVLYHSTMKNITASNVLFSLF